MRSMHMLHCPPSLPLPHPRLALPLLQTGSLAACMQKLEAIMGPRPADQNFGLESLLCCKH